MRSRHTRTPRELSFTILTLVVVLALVSTPRDAYAWLRLPVEDLLVVQRSELIIVGHLRNGSIKRVEDPPPSSDSRGPWRFHATLVITEVLKGKQGGQTVPVVIHYGLTPVVEGTSVKMFDTANSAGLILANAEKDNLWFLRRRSGPLGRQPGHGVYGIVDPEDVQALGLRDYFRNYLSNDPARAVRKYLKEVPASVRQSRIYPRPGKPHRHHPRLIAERAQRYIDHVAVGKILKNPDPQLRLRKLLPFYVRRTWWNGTNEARQGIIECGEIAGSLLLSIFDNKNLDKELIRVWRGLEHLRRDIISIWGEIGYTDAVPILIEVLQEADRFWATQHLEEGWWNKNVGSDLTEKRQNIYMVVITAVSALGELRDRRARTVLEQTRKRWKDSGLGIAEECAVALKNIRKN